MPMAAIAHVERIEDHMEEDGASIVGRARVGDSGVVGEAKVGAEEAIYSRN